MRILFDQGTPAPLRHLLAQHDVSTAYEMGWSTLDNGELINAAEASFDLLITTDQNIEHQQDLSGRGLAVIILPTTSWPKIRANIRYVTQAIGKAAPGRYLKVSFPSD
jgi:hypothetical protein